MINKIITLIYSSYYLQVGISHTQPNARKSEQFSNNNITFIKIHVKHFNIMAFV